MTRQIIVPATGLLPHRPYSPAVRAGNTLYVSGHTGSDPLTREIRNGIEEQTRQAFRNLQDVIEAAGASMRNVVKANIFMTDMAADFEGMNKVFREVFPEMPPARSTVGVAHLARPGLLVEIDVIAVMDEGSTR
ncbi:RidA family protein [Bordetella avium]|uniref:RidA family protein n=1 Tax=Bordetella avium TaxID=521 RepID=UPI000E678C6A|nr:RidA family protein [Bordetella avium]AZY48746.1 RidA family protein [Bordetella avium]AZY52125.1 RidA family protein [Bordetella avium]RIQ17925.1 RidA family protein [Bordetella avium]RIQ36401.1 RidA family protein [Bordetella avium]RIQ39751.1 RidA family protein [Bordetella avium]